MAVADFIDRDPVADRTLRRMVASAIRASSDARVVGLANKLVRSVTARWVPGRIAAVRSYVQRRFVFVPNPVSAQRMRDPATMVDELEHGAATYGACNDAAVLLAALFLSVGFRVRFRALALCADRNQCADDVPYGHVICDVYDGRDWQPLDITSSHDWERPPYIMNELTIYVE